MSQEKQLYELVLSLLEQMDMPVTQAFRQTLPVIESLAYQPLPPTWLTVASVVSDLQIPRGFTVDLVTAVRSSYRAQAWRQPYKVADFGELFFHHVAWFPIADKDGPLLYDQGLVEIMLIDANTCYPSHKHAPEELYIVLSGQVFWQAEGHAPGWKSAGDVIHHLPHQIHAISTANEPALILSLWRGGGFEMPEIT